MKEGVIYMVGLDSDKIEFIAPEYVSNIGNCTRVYTEDGSKVIKRSIKTVVKNICKQKKMTYSLSRSQCIEILGIKHNIPISLGPEDIYIKVKTRTPYCKNDGAYGYLNLKFFDSLIEKSGQIFIRIDSGRKILVISKRKTLERNINNGRILSIFIKKQMEIDRINLENIENKRLLREKYLNLADFKNYRSKLEGILVYENKDWV